MNIYQDLMGILKRSPSPDSELNIINTNPVTRTSYHIDHLVCACYMALGTLLNEIREKKNDKREQITIDFMHSALTLISFLLNSQNGNPVQFPERHLTWPYYPTMGSYKTRDAKDVYIVGAYPILRDGLLDLLNSPNNFEAIRKAILNWDSINLEEQINQRNLAGCIIRTTEEWLNHPQGKILSNSPPIKIEKNSETPPVSLPSGDLCLSGLKVLDITHLLAGPTATRTLAEQGAQVLHISGPKVDELFPFVVDTGLGKSNTFLDLRNEKDHNTLIELIKEADVFVTSFAPGKLQQLGFGAQEIHAINPKTIYVAISTYGDEGPWSTYKGFEQIAQAVSGIMVGHSSLDNPLLFPAAPCDYVTGHFATLGILEALLRRSQEGGSYTVNVSLVRTAMFLEQYGHRQNNEGKDTSGAFPEDFEPYLQIYKSAFGDIKLLKPVLQTSSTPTIGNLTITPIGSGLPIWK